LISTSEREIDFTFFFDRSSINDEDGMIPWISNTLCVCVRERKSKKREEEKSISKSTKTKRKERKRLDDGINRNDAEIILSEIKFVSLFGFLPHKDPEVVVGIQQSIENITRDLSE
jgi:hypothetical protein